MSYWSQQMSIQFGFIKPKYTLQYFMIAQHSVKLEVKMPTSLDKVQKLFCGPSGGLNQ